MIYITHKTFIITKMLFITLLMQSINSYSAPTSTPSHYKENLILKIQSKNKKLFDNILQLLIFNINQNNTVKKMLDNLCRISTCINNNHIKEQSSWNELIKEINEKINELSSMISINSDCGKKLILNIQQLNQEEEQLHIYWHNLMKDFCTHT